jgi:NADH:ubiquinone oxidoreductase subunit K
MNLPIPLIVLIIVLGLAGIGFYCLLVIRNLIKVVIALQLIIKGVIVAFMLAAHLVQQDNLGQTLGVTIIVADTIVAVVGLSLAVQIRLRTGNLDIKTISNLKR